MEKPMRPAPLDVLARWIFRDLDRGAAVLGIPQANFALPDPRMAGTRHGRPLAAPLGVAAGPHTQLAQNIVAAWLCGARFIELKTVQILDQLHVARPCIDAADATYNCEWSQELTLDESFGEYLKAWVLVHALARRLGLAAPGAVFNLSVGYDLPGIQGEKVQLFLRRMRDASGHLPAAVAAVAAAWPGVRDVPIPAEISNHVTLSTMHGCPPREIERIARYLLADLGLNTWVKLNPTLLGPERLRGILNDRMGFDIAVPDAAFDHDPRFEDALEMVRHLADAARALPVAFGLKLSNTLEVVNRRQVFPASERMMYLSGRALHPLTLTLAHRVTEALDGRVPISFCGGADATNFARLVADGLAPVTVCTDLLKPGGYARLGQYLANLGAEMDGVGARSLDEFCVRSAIAAGRAEKVAAGAAACARDNLARHAEAVLDEPRLHARSRPLAVKGSRPLGSFDCIAAPCREGCPSQQNIPDYIFLVGRGRTAEALEVILQTNCLPSVTGSVCDMPCTERCVRNQYDDPLAIRELKRYAVEAAAGAAPDSSPVPTAPPQPQSPLDLARVAVIGAGPAGLAAAWVLVRLGFPVALFEARRTLGGMVSGAIPPYRLGAAAIARDLERIRAAGVDVRLGQRLGHDLRLEDLRRQGYRYFVLAVGAAAGKRLGIPGEGSRGVLDALEFLGGVRAGKPAELGRRVLVVGGGNSAMDAARTARRVVPYGAVTLVYRRTRAQMPAHEEEVQACVDEGIEIRDLLAPVEVAASGGQASALVCQQMKLGEPDASGRPRPVPIEGARVALPCDHVIVAISQEPVLDFLDGEALERRPDGTLRVDPETGATSVRDLFAAGDVVRGPASIIAAIADGRRAAAEIARRHGLTVGPEPELAKGLAPDALLAKKARRAPRVPVPVLPVERRAGFDQVLLPFNEAEARREADRCLDCDELCSLCVTVCPNRANVAYTTPALRLEVPTLELRGGALVTVATRTFAVRQEAQTLNVVDFCNECGNCDTFCPAAGAPWRDKPRCHLDPEGFAAARGDAFRFVREGDGVLRLEARLGGRLHQLRRADGWAEYRGPQVRARWRPETWELLEARPLELAEGERVDLGPCATLLVLWEAAAVLPV